MPNYTTTHTQDPFFSRPDRVIKHRHGGAERADLFVVTPVFNNARWRSRWKLFQDFARWVYDSGARLYVVEVAFGHRDFVITPETVPTAEGILHLETKSEIWHKEASINLLVQRLPIDWQYVCVSDADLTLARADWANEAVQQLQHFPIIQMWSEADDLGPDYTSIAHHHSFVWSWMHNMPQSPDHDGYYLPPNPNKFIEYHPGYIWGYTKEAWNNIGGLLNFALLGAADNHMAHALIGDAERTIHPGMSTPYREAVLRWQDQALLHIKRNIGMLDCKLLHYFHGAKKKRKYWDRWRILVDNHYNPETDIKFDWQGLYQLIVDNHRQQRLRDQMHRYYIDRDEDSTSAE